MSTIFPKEFKKIGGRNGPGDVPPSAPREARCSLCRGELYPGDPYFALDGRTVCEDCLGRYARGYFAPRLRWVGVDAGNHNIVRRNEEHP